MTFDAAGYLTIGQFSRLSTITVRMLRYYDEQGVLAPRHVDSASGYRYYHPDQLPEARLAASLRDVGCPVAMIARLVPLSGNPAAMARELTVQRDSLAAQLDDVRRRVEGIEKMITHLKGDAMSVPIRETTFPAYRCASLRDVIASYEAEGELWHRLSNALAAIDPALMSYAPAEAVPCAVALFHDDGYQLTDVDVEIRWAMPPDFAGSDDAPRLDVPQVRAIVGTLHGSFDGMPAVSQALADAIAERGLSVSGPMFNVYVVGGAQTPDQAQWVTEVCLPVG